ncbi:co-chaperone DjlA [Orbaceae bacterium ac157xtp]
MSFIWAIVTGFILTSVFKSGWAFFLGFFIGPMLYRAFNNIAPVRNSQPDPALFMDVSFEVLGHISKAKGQVTSDDIALALGYMNQFQLNSEQRRLAQEAFNRGKSANYPLRERLQELYLHYRTQKKLLRIFCEQLILAAIHDGDLHIKEKEILYTVAQEFRISQTQMTMFIQMMMASYQFQHGSSSRQESHHYQQQGGNQYQYQRTSSQSDLDNAYKILGVSSTADVTTIKRAYRKLMNEYHPDKLVSKGLPKAMLESAKKRAQEIQAAYDLIKAHKGFK